MNVKHAFFLVKLLEDTGYRGFKHFDSHAYRTSDRADVIEFARGSCDVPHPEGKGPPLARRPGREEAAGPDEPRFEAAREADREVLE